MLWTIDFLKCLLFTAVTGSIMFLVWQLIGSMLSYLERLMLVYRLLWAVALAFLVPAVYLLLVFLGNRYSERLWFVWLFGKTPVLQYVSSVGTAVWLLGAVVSAGRQLLLLHRQKCMFWGLIPAGDREFEVFYEVCRELGIPKGRVILYTCPRRIVPFHDGLIAPRVVISSGEYTLKELRLIFSHELTHYKHRDLWLKAVVVVLKVVQWFNPFVWLLSAKVRAWSEYACDYEACRYVGGEKRYLVGLGRLALEADEEMPLSSQLGNRNELFRRIERMTKYSHKGRRSTALAAALTMCMMIMSAGAVYAGTMGLAEGYIAVREATNVDVLESEETVFPIEYVDGEEYIDDTVEGIAVEFGLVELWARSSTYYFSWTVNGNSQKTSSTIISATENQYIHIEGYTGSGEILRVGIIEPDGTKRCIYATGPFSHDFRVGKAGNHRIYAENRTEGSIGVTGQFWLK